VRHALASARLTAVAARAPVDVSHRPARVGANRRAQSGVAGVWAAYMFCTRTPIGTQPVSSNATATQRIVLAIPVSLLTLRSTVRCTPPAR
jgi:hypothetical protein